MKDIEQTPLTKGEKKALERAIELLKEGYPLKRVILFGSKARGGFDDQSDLDLLVVTSRALHWKEEKAIVETLFEIGLQYDVIFSSLFASETEWEGGLFTEFPIYKEIIRDGAVVE
jgi:predicted nucleotidyltransferase